MTDDSAARLHAECSRALDNDRVWLPRILTVESLRHAISVFTDTEVIVSYVPQAQLVRGSGNMCRTPSAIHIWLAEEASVFTQTRTMAHEFGHLLAKDPLDEVSDALAAIFGPNEILLESGYGQHFLMAARCFQNSRSPGEQKAEMYARVIHERVTTGATNNPSLHRRVFGA